MHKLNEFIESLDPNYKVAFDTETTGLKFYEDHVFGFSLAQLYPVQKSIWCRLDPKNVDWILPLKLFLANKKYKKVGFNLKFDWLFMLEEYGINVINNYEDAMIKTYLWNELIGPYKLKSLCDKLIGTDPRVIEVVEARKKIDEILSRDKKKTFEDVPDELMSIYAPGDSIITLLLDEHVSKTWPPELDRVFQLENDLLQVLVMIEQEGVDVDVEYLNKLNSDFLGKRAWLLKYIAELDIINTRDNDAIVKVINSDKQLGKLLYDTHGLRTVQGTKLYTPGGNYQTDADALDKLYAANKGNKFGMFLDKIKEFSTVEHMLNTYIEPYLEQGLKYGKVYPSYWQSTVVTGRLSCTNPNMQNIPKKDEKFGDEIRHIIFNRMFPDYIIDDYDYSQIELRIMAHYCKSPKWIEAFTKGADLHQATADELGISRRDAKDMNFGIIYGMGAAGFAKKLKCSKQKAYEYLNNYFAKNAEIKVFSRQVQSVVDERGYTRTFLGRRRHLESKKAYVGVNAIIQGTAAEIIKLAMVRMYEEFRQEVVKMKMQIHDELVITRPRDPKYIKQITELMEDTTTFRVPIRVEHKEFGKNWGIGK